MNNPEYQRIFNAFNAFSGDPKKSLAARDFLTFSATPDIMLQTLLKARIIASKKEEGINIQDHKTTYLRGLDKSLDSDAWNESHAARLISITDWLISLRDKSHHSTNYLQLLRRLVAKIPQKIPVSLEKTQAWNKALLSKRTTYFPNIVKPPVDVYGRDYRRPYTQNYSADDRN